MKIEWNIVKKRGNYRPVLHYTAVLNEFERGLCLHAVRVMSTIPKPPDGPAARQSTPHCAGCRNSPIAGAAPRAR